MSYSIISPAPTELHAYPPIDAEALGSIKAEKITFPAAPCSAAVVGATMDALSWTLQRREAHVRHKPQYLTTDVKKQAVSYVMGSQKVTRLRCATASREPSRLNATLVAGVSR